MNLDISTCVQKFKNLFFSKTFYNCKILHNRHYNDQNLWEILFLNNDNTTSLLSIYLTEIVCSCREKDCIHAKFTCSIFKKQSIKQLLESFQDYTLVKTGVKSCQMNNHETHWNNLECPICFTSFCSPTKVIWCKTCKNAIHKTCWRNWETKKNVDQFKKPNTITYPQCIICKSYFYNCVDNEDYVI